MNILKTKAENTMTVALEGRLDTVTAPRLEAELRTSVSGIEKLVLDLEKLDYISSSGLRVLLSAQKVMNRQGEMIVCHVQPGIMEIFEVTGFSEMLHIEE